MLNQLGARLRPFLMAVALMLGLALTIAGCGGGGGGGGGAPAPSPNNPPQTVSVLASLQSNLQSVQTDASFQSTLGEPLVTSVTQGSTTVSGADLHIRVNNDVFQAGGASTFQVKAGDVITVFRKGDPSQTTTPYTHK